jgi:hypothetical protein
MIDGLKGIDRRLGAIFGGDYNDDILEIKSIQQGGVLTTISFTENKEDEKWTESRYDVTVLLPFSTISKDATPNTMQTQILHYAHANTGILKCRDASIRAVEMITIIDIKPHTNTPIIVGERRFIIAND